MEKLTKKGLDGTQLKTIALVLMVLDHIHYFFEFTGCIPTVFSMLGRLSAPLFLFCTVEGFAHTHDRRRYFIRIWAIGAAMAALEFFMIYAKAFRRGDGFYPQNAIFQDLVLLCIVWQGIDWLREKKFAKGIGAIAAVLCWPYVVVVFLLLFPGVQEMPIASTIVAFVITSPLPMWTTITDGGWSFLLGGVLLYALRGHRRVQLTAWAVLIFLCDFVPTFGMLCRQADFVWTQMFTDYYEWFGVAAVLLMLLYNGQRGSGHKRLFYWFYPAHVYLLYGASCLVYNVLRGSCGEYSGRGRQSGALQADPHHFGAGRPPGRNAAGGRSADRGALPLGRLHSAGCDDARGGWLCGLSAHPQPDRSAHPVSERPHR